MTSLVSRRPRLLAALLAAALCLVPAVAPARAPDPVQTAISEIAAATEPYQRLILDSVALLNFTMKGANQALIEEGPDKPPWLDDWKAKIAAARQTVAAERAALKPFRSATMDAHASEPEVARLRTALRGFPATVGAMADKILATVDQLVPLTETAATGDLADKERLQVTVLRATNENIEAQDALIDLGLAAVPAAHPEAGLNTGIKFIHDARRRIQQYRIDEMSGLNPDPKLAMAEARASLAQARATLGKVRGMADAMIKDVQASTMTPALKAKTAAALGTYGASADVELKFADLIERSLKFVFEPYGDNAEAMALNQEMEELSRQRVALQTQRQDMVR